MSYNHYVPTMYAIIEKVYPFNLNIYWNWEGGSGGQWPFFKKIPDFVQLAVGRFYFLIA